MPCSFCHQPGHTIAKCNADISEFEQPFLDLVSANPFDLRQQYVFLCSYSKPVLTLINRSSGSKVDGTKPYLIGNIIKRYFVQLYIVGILEVNEDTSQQMEDAYSSLTLWVTLTTPLIAMRQELKSILNALYERTFGTSISLAQFLRYLQENPLPVAQVDPKAHLRNLAINITVDPSLVVQDCFMCCDDKPLAALGCGHNYCTDCLINTAVTRTKSVIICALCREEVTDVKVGTEELRAAVTNRFAEE
jgi:hypothetical protein